MSSFGPTVLMFSHGDVSLERISITYPDGAAVPFATAGHATTTEPSDVFNAAVTDPGAIVIVGAEVKSDIEVVPGAGNVFADVVGGMAIDWLESFFSGRVTKFCAGLGFVIASTMMFFMDTGTLDPAAFIALT